VATQARAARRHEAKAALDRLAAAAVCEGRFEQRLRVAALATFARRWLIPRRPAFQRRHPDIDLHLVTARTPAVHFQVEVDVVLSGRVGEARLPVLSPALVRPFAGRSDPAHAAPLRNEPLR
jgi:LysR family transcriptional regulator, glycine cleavage system transcriptional activator